MAANPESVKTGSDVADQIIVVILSTGMFIAGIFGFVLDNTIPGKSLSNHIFAVAERS